MTNNARTRSRRRMHTGLSCALACMVGMLCVVGCQQPNGSSFWGDVSTEEVGRPGADYARCMQPRLDAFREKIGAPGVTAAVVLSDARPIAIASGVSNRESGEAMKGADRMLAGSVGKTFVSAVMLQLVEEGRADLDTKISHWLGEEPWFSRLPNVNGITLRMLMNHTSGIREHVAMPEFHAAIAADKQKVWKPEELIAYVLDTPPLFPVGKSWSYADTNYILVGMIIERITGRPFYADAMERFIKPLGLKDTFPSDQNPLPDLVNGYSDENNPFPVSDVVVSNGYCEFNPQMEWTGGGFVSTSRDLAQWARLLYDGDVLKAESKDAMLAGVPTPRFGPNHSYGLGVIIRTSKYGRVYGHSGWFPGYLTMMAYYPKYDLAVAVQINADTWKSHFGQEAFVDELAGAILELDHPDLADDAEKENEQNKAERPRRAAHRVCAKVAS